MDLAWNWIRKHTTDLPEGVPFNWLDINDMILHNAMASILLKFHFNWWMDLKEITDSCTDVYFKSYIKK